MILGGLNQEFHQTPSSKERISLILSEVGETHTVKCIYSMNKSATALKSLQRNTEMQGCIRWANWCAGIRTEVSLWDVTLRGTWLLGVRSLWSSPQEVRLCSPWDSQNRKCGIGKKLIFSDTRRGVSTCKNQNKQIFQMYWGFHHFFFEIFCFVISSPECLPRAGLAAALWVAMLKQGNALLVSSAAPLTLCAWWWKELGMEEGKKKALFFFVPREVTETENAACFPVWWCLMISCHLFCHRKPWFHLLGPSAARLWVKRDPQAFVPAGSLHTAIIINNNDPNYYSWLCSDEALKAFCTEGWELIPCSA